MNFCKDFLACHITYNPFSNKIVIGRCCLKYAYSFAEYNIDEWIAIPNKLAEINKYVNVWNNREGERDLIPGHCDPKLLECYYSGHLDRFNKIEIAIDVACNANCSWCGFTHFANTVRENGLTKKVKELYYNTLNSIIDNADYEIGIRLTDHGEPLIWKKDFIDVLKKCDNNPNIRRVYITTNGFFMVEPDVLQALNNSNKVIIRVSLNALSPNSRKRIMGIDRFDDIIQSIDVLQDKIVELSIVVDSFEELDEIHNLLPEFRKKCLKRINLFPNTQKVEADPSWAVTVANFIEENKNLLWIGLGG